MNNLEKIKNFTLEEMIDFLLYIDTDGINDIYCNRVCKYKGDCDYEVIYSCRYIRQRECIKAILESDCSICASHE